MMGRVVVESVEGKKVGAAGCGLGVLVHWDHEARVGLSRYVATHGTRLHVVEVVDGSNDR